MMFGIVCGRDTPVHLWDAFTGELRVSDVIRCDCCVRCDADADADADTE